MTEFLSDQTDAVREMRKAAKMSALKKAFTDLHNELFVSNKQAAAEVFEAFSHIPKFSLPRLYDLLHENTAEKVLAEFFGMPEK